MPNFSSLAGLEVGEKFVVVGWGGVVVEHVTRDIVKKKTDYLVTSIKRVGRYHAEITIS